MSEKNLPESSYQHGLTTSEAVDDIYEHIKMYLPKKGSVKRVAERVAKERGIKLITASQYVMKVKNRKREPSNDLDIFILEELVKEADKIANPLKKMGKKIAA